MILLQVYASASIIGFVFLGFFGFLIGVILTRWIFSIGDLLRNQRITNRLLSQIAKANGVSEEEVLGALGKKLPKQKRTQLQKEVQ